MPRIPGGGSGDTSGRLVQKKSPAIHIATLAEVQKEAKERSKNIYASYHLLHEILLRHELTIQKRWAKKIRQQRQKILLDNWLGMPATHRPDFEAVRQTNRADGKTSKSGDEFKNHFMWPYINHEDLLTPKPLLLLLNARGRNPPPAFANFDRYAMLLGFASYNLVPIYLSEHSMLLNGARNAGEYGKLMEWVNQPHTFDWKQFTPGEGLLILEAQERLLKFLVDCCKQIMIDIPAEDLTAPDFTIQPEPHLKTGQESSGFDSLVVMVAEAPYRLPPQLDLARMERMLGGRLAAAEDHLWALREDPGYFLEQLTEMKEHREELIPDKYGHAHSVLKSQETFWARVCSVLVTEAYLPLEYFAGLHRQSRALQQLHKKHEVKISPTEYLPEEFLSAILTFSYWLYRAAYSSLESLEHYWYASAPWRSYAVCRSHNGTVEHVDVMLNAGKGMSELQKRFLWLFDTLSQGDHEIVHPSLSLVVNEVGRLLETEPRAKDILTACIAKVISDMASISWCIDQLNTYFPWARSFQSVVRKREGDFKKEFAERFKPCKMAVSALDPENLSQISRLGNPRNQKFAYPVEQPRTKKNVEALRQAEQNLDDFWAAIDTHVKAKCGGIPPNSANQRVLTQPRNTIRRTPEWVEPASSVTKSGKEAVLDPGIEQLYKPLSKIYTDTDKPVETITPPTTKKKPETKTTPRSANIQEDSSISVDKVPPAPASIGVDGRALKVFRTLFFNPAVTAVPGEVSWSDFIHAMVSTGLFTPEKIYGSGWQFQRLDGDQSRIQFYEPHSGGKIPFTTAWHYGRRLNRAFGWDGNTFYLKGKGKGKGK
ncbi:hypothetical protein F5Y14DRAFT_458873 [Nemania sp. NC0429]|nr:hypothetical protein F5Y14DRAFT_458873 [Nemania sp. NC0429]